MIEACRFVWPDGYKGYWHTSNHFIDLMLAMTLECDNFSLECKEFADQEAVDDANDQHTY